MKNKNEKYYYKNQTKINRNIYIKKHYEKFG